ncbi:MAG: hypothetical protein M1831_004498 [Alyxoria varia]|nr:MAG: hypothetical protein M1831_004498 [Alyxoria varia]
MSANDYYGGQPAHGHPQGYPPPQNYGQPGYGQPGYPQPPPQTFDSTRMLKEPWF